MSIGRALDRAELADVMARADVLYLRWAQTLQGLPLAQWSDLLAAEAELHGLPVDEQHADAYRSLILRDLDRLLHPVSDEGASS